MVDVNSYILDEKEHCFVVKEAKGSYVVPLEKRIFDFVVKVVKYLDIIQKSTINNVIIYQLAKSATSQGANYEEAQGDSSKKDFIAKISIAHREAKETNYWLRIIHASGIDSSEELQYLLQESMELRNILGSIVGKVRRGSKK